MDTSHSRALERLPSQRLLKAEDWFLDGALRIDVWRTNSATEYRMHSHDFYELVVVVRGSIDHRLASNTIRASAGDVFGIPPGVEHGYSRPASCDYISIIFDELGIESRFPELRSIPEYAAFMRLEPSLRGDSGGIELLKLEPADLFLINDWARRIEDEIEGRARGYAAVVSSALLDILVTVCRRYDAGTRAGSAHLVGIARAIRKIEEDYGEALDLDGLVTASCMSKRSFMRHFCQAVGDTPMSYLRRVRVEAARRLLASSSASVTEIAAQAGFEDSNHFSRVFKEETGMSPLAYRRASAG